MSCAVLGLAAVATLGLASCGSGSGSSGKEGGTLNGTYAVLPRLPGPGALLHRRRLDGDVRRLHPAADLHARRRRRRQRSDPRPGQRTCRRSATAARPTRSSSAPASNTPTARRSRPPTSPTRSNASSRSTPAARPSTPTSSAPKSSPKRRPAASPASKTNDKTGEIVIHLIKPRGTFTNELGLMFVAPVPPDTPNEEPVDQPAARHRPLRDHQVRAGPRLGLRTQPLLGESQLEGDARPARAATSTRSTSRSSATPRPRSTTSSRASTTGCRPAAARPLRRKSRANTKAPSSGSSRRSAPTTSG